MALLISQDRILVKPGEAMTTEVWVENTTPSGSVFTLTLRPADANLGQDWYQSDVQPRAGQNIPPGGGGSGSP